MFTSERRRVRADEAATAAREADRLRLEEALAPYERAIAVSMLPGHYQADVIDLRDVLPSPAPAPPALRTRRRRNRPLVYIAATS